MQRIEIPGTTIQKYCEERGAIVPQSLEEWAMSGGTLTNYMNHSDMTGIEVKGYTWLMRKVMGLRKYLSC